MSYGKITYNMPALHDAASNMAGKAAAMTDLHADVSQRTNALLPEFSGINAGTYFEHQQPFLQAFEHLIETVQRFAQTVVVVTNDAGDTDSILAARL